MAEASAVADGVVCLHEDAHLLVLDKPAELLCVPGRGPDKQDCLSARALQRWPDALVVHRLDQATSGLVLMARSLQMQRALGQAFAAQRVDKRYQAVVQGVPAGADGGWHAIDLPIAADWERRPLRVVDPAHGKPSLTRWRCLPGAQADAQRTRLELQPVTGRTHQLRVHLAAIGHPILGDALYGTGSAQAQAARLLLHACRLELTHPMHGGRLRVESPCPF
ncbi:ribosomal large subunit pseudouridine synthase A [Oryzisolibacter propanilivorax]|uniref:Ribosomal large subunit pseudouridine synthase A n=1 Tax=Oryzisolibacter propanilivorax TaxID=1527607 RepID=A0A1G9P752_9BURK|nr:RluA family pseudouridine synthase [Oryzisolibacter propanilivorax]SDL94570.1 ribosomal large subunit pseudouridine synthase A [Oryzisolibacter propanilivorax]